MFLKRWRNWLILGVVVAAVFMFTSRQQRSAWIARLTAKDGAALVLVRVNDARADASSAHVSATVMNESGRALDNVSVRCKVNDRSGGMIDAKTQRASSSGIPAGFRGDVDFTFDLQGRPFGNAECSAVDVR